MAANNRTQGKAKDDQESMEGLFQSLGFFGSEVIAERLNGQAQVSDAHGGGDAGGGAGGFYLSETFHLCAAGKGNETVGDGMMGGGDPRDSEKQQGFQKNDELPPMDMRAVPIMYAGQGGQGNPQSEGENGEQIGEGFAQLPLSEMNAEQQNVPGLRIGKNLTSGQIGVGIHKPAGAGEEQGQGDGI